LLGETSAVVGRALGSAGTGGLFPWTYGYRWGGIQNGTPTGIDAGWFMIDHKIVANPINFAGKNFYLNETPFTSSHPGGVNMSFCDGSVRFMPNGTDLKVLQMLATRAGGGVVPLPWRRDQGSFGSSSRLERCSASPPQGGTTPWVVWPGHRRRTDRHRHRSEEFLR